MWYLSEQICPPDSSMVMSIDAKGGISNHILNGKKLDKNHSAKLETDQYYFLRIKGNSKSDPALYLRDDGTMD